MSGPSPDERIRLILLAQTASRRPLRPAEHDALATGITAAWAINERLRKRIAELEVRNRSYEETILSQRRELLTAPAQKGS